MTILVDQPVDEVQVDLNQNAEADNQNPGQESQQEQESAGVSIPEKFKGKTAEEIAEAYVNLESEVGRMRNDLGDYRSMTDRFLSLEEKRVADLEQQGQEVDEFKIDPTELLANPEEVLGRWQEHARTKDPVYAQMQQRLDQLEGKVVARSFEDAHPDANDITASKEFHEWVNSAPSRTRLANIAVQGKDTDALSDLLTEYKMGLSATDNTSTTPKVNNEVADAKKVSTESSSTGSAVDTGKRFSRRKLVDLKINNPEEYAARSQEILLAYAQKRVDD